MAHVAVEAAFATSRTPTTTFASVETFMLFPLRIAGIDSDSGAIARINLFRIKFEVGSIGSAVRKNLEKVLQAVISLILFAVLDDASEEIFFLRVDLNGAAEFNRPEAELASVWNKAESLFNVRKIAVAQ